LMFRLKRWWCIIIGNWIITLPWMVSFIRILIYISEITLYRKYKIPLFSGFSITNNELHQKLCTKTLVIRWYSLASNFLSIWQHVATDFMFLNAKTYLKVVSRSFAFRNYLMWMVIFWMSWNLISPNTRDI
jgi:hypothetical protein